MITEEQARTHGAQLPDDAGATVAFEQPTTERVRNFLRLEHLFVNVNQAIATPSRWGSRQAVVNILEIVDLLSRTDFKAELIKELERHATVITGLSDNPGVDPVMLRQITMQIDRLVLRLKAADCQPTQRIRSDELLNQVKQRIAIPGGACSFDLPAFHHWQHRAIHERVADLNTWMEDLRVIESAIDTVLADIRESAVPITVTAAGGFYQQTIDQNAQVQLVRVLLPRATGFFPEISGGKHRFTIRLLRQQSSRDRPEQIEDSIVFRLQCCGI